MEFEAGKAMLRGPDMFPRMRVTGEGVPIGEAKLAADEMLVAVERGGEARAFLLSHVAYHHLVQGTLAGEPYLVSF